MAIHARMPSSSCCFLLDALYSLVIEFCHQPTWNMRQEEEEVLSLCIELRLRVPVIFILIYCGFWKYFFSIKIRLNTVKFSETTTNIRSRTMSWNRLPYSQGGQLAVCLFKDKTTQSNHRMPASPNPPSFIFLPLKLTHNSFTWPEGKNNTSRTDLATRLGLSVLYIYFKEIL